jgi:hypothetical protein
MTLQLVSSYWDKLITYCELDEASVAFKERKELDEKVTKNYLEGGVFTGVGSAMGICSYCLYTSMTVIPFAVPCAVVLAAMAALLIPIKGVGHIMASNLEYRTVLKNKLKALLGGDVSDKFAQSFFKMPEKMGYYASGDMSLPMLQRLVTTEEKVAGCASKTFTADEEKELVTKEDAKSLVKSNGIEPTEALKRLSLDEKIAALRKEEVSSENVRFLLDKLPAKANEQICEKAGKRLYHGDIGFSKWLIDILPDGKTDYAAEGKKAIENGKINPSQEIVAFIEAIQEKMKKDAPVCPITKKEIKEPVKIAACGHVYEKEELENRKNESSGNKCVECDGKIDSIVKYKVPDLLKEVLKGWN